MPIMSWMRLGILFAFLCIESSPRLFALNRDVQINQLHHTSWTDENSGLGGILSIVQGADGFLWLVTTDAHLLRFDGVRFDPIEAAMAGIVGTGEHSWDDIFSVYASPDGGLWIGHGKARVDIIRGGTRESYSTQSCFAKGSVGLLAPQKNGGVWIGTPQGLGLLQSGRCDPIGASAGYTGGTPVALLVDMQGNVWVKGSDGHLFFLRNGSKRFEINVSGSGTPGPEGYLAQSPDGNIWQSGPSGLQQIIQNANLKQGQRASQLGPYAEVGKFLFSRDGSLWFTSVGTLYRIAHPETLVPWQPKPKDYSRDSKNLEELKNSHAHIQAFRSKQGLSGDEVSSLLEDREGNVWTGTSSGLDRFRDNLLIKAALPPAPVEQFALARGSHGSLWAATWSSPLFHITNDGVSSEPIGDGQMSALYSDPDDILWIGTTDALWHWTPLGFKKAAQFPTQGPDYVVAMCANPAGGLWVSFGAHGLFLLRNGIWTAQNKRLGIPDIAAVYAITTDDRGRIYFFQGLLHVLDGDNMQVYHTGPGYATAINVRGPHTWVGGVRGFGLLAGGKFQVIQGVDNEAFRGVTGIIERVNGDVWMNSLAGVVLIRASEVQRVTKDPHAQVNFERFSALDGLDGKANIWRPSPTISTDSEGKLWFATNKGVFRLDPDSVGKLNAVVTLPVIVTAMSTGDQDIQVHDNLRLAAHTQNVRLDYTALNLGTPERLSFRYKLEKVDQKWQDAGNRRQAFYTNLSPGRYRFLVSARNGSGEWSTGTPISFVITPAWYQTSWFECLCAIAFVGILWWLYTLRVMHVTARVHERMSERLRERERIARELHDTLLQGVQALMLRLHTVVNLVPDTLPVHGMIQSAVYDAEGVMTEGRDRVGELRSHQSSEEDLVERIAKMVNGLGDSDDPRVSISTLGIPFATRTLIAEEITLIGREAITNALRHSQCSKVSCELRFEQHQVVLICEDDGIGISDELVTVGKTDHWGIRGMIERARKISSSLKISSVGVGTRVELRVPGRIVRSRFSFSLWPLNRQI
jgi:signal transduction histidine kinase/ligand-binding sensor domain-containing protein